MQCFGDLIAMEGTNANEPCRIGSIRPRRQARERRSLQPSKSQVPSGKNNGFNAADVFAACAEPTRDNQYTTFKPTLRFCFSFRLFDLMPPALTGSRGVL